MKKILVVIGEDELAAIEDWRRRQPVIPSRSEAIRRLIAKGLERPPESKED